MSEVLPVHPSGGISSTPVFEESLTKLGVSEEVIRALRRALVQATVERGSSHYYARSMPRAVDDYGMEGLKMQIQYLLLYLAQWQGEEARASKKVLRKFTTARVK